jgi:hypothetical protein
MISLGLGLGIGPTLVGGVKCPWTGGPFVIVNNGASVGYEYAHPIDVLLIGCSGRCPITGVGLGPGSFGVFWYQNVPLGYEAAPFDVTDIGSNLVGVYGWNCSGNYDGGFSFYDVQASGWTAGAPRVVLNQGGNASIEAGPSPASINFYDFIAWDDQVAATVTVTSGVDTLYSGPYSTSMINNTYFDCTKVGTFNFDMTFTNGSGSTVLSTFVILQDPNSYCP